MTTYNETIYRYRVIKRDMRCLNDDQYRAILRLNGIDPDDSWSLIWSFKSLEKANEVCEAEIADHAEFCDKYGCAKMYEYKVVDAGQDQIVERMSWF